MKDATLAFIGAGNMGHSLIGGLINDGFDPKKIWATDLHEEKLQELSARYQVQVTTDNSWAIAQADVLILAVKPQVMKQVTLALAAEVQKRQPLIISIAAGIPLAYLHKWLGDHLSIVRCMPNTPALVGSGATALYPNELVSDTQRDLAESIMRAVGITVWLEEEAHMDIVTALSGSGPAYFFLMMEALEQGAKDLGLPEHSARLLILQTALGAARMALESSDSIAELRRRVTSPGGTTEHALKMLEIMKAPQAFIEALYAAKGRAEELTESLE